jgi:hypothetical protein
MVRNDEHADPKLMIFHTMAFSRGKHSVLTLLSAGCVVQMINVARESEDP